MRVLHLGIEPTWRGGENQIRLLVRGLKARGIETFVAYPKSSEGYARFSQECETLPLASTSSIDPRSVFRLIRFCRKKAITHLDAHSSASHTLALLVKRFLPHLKLVVHRRVDNPISQRTATKSKYLSPRVNQFVAISDCIRQILIDYGVDPAKVTAIKSAVDPAPYAELNVDQIRSAWRSRFHLDDGTLLIGNASAFTDQKGHDVFIKSLSELKKTSLNFHAFLAGDGPLLSEMKALAQSLELTEQISFLGFIKEVPQFLTCLDILAIPSNNEGLGTLVLDALYAGCAVCATRVGGLPEMIIHNHTGLLCEKGDHLALAVNLEKLLRSPELRHQLSLAGRQHIDENFSLETMVSGNLEIYQSL